MFSCSDTLFLIDVVYLYKLVEFRWQFLLDTAWMLHHRSLALHQYQQAAADDSSVKYIMVDSSPLNGKDYEMILVCEIEKQRLQRLLDIADTLIFLRRLSGAGPDGDASRGGGGVVVFRPTLST